MPARLPCRNPFRHWRRAVRQDWQRLFWHSPRPAGRSSTRICRLTLNGTQNVCARPGSLPAADKYAAHLSPEMATAFDYLPENAIVIIEDTPVCATRCAISTRVADDVTALLERGEMPPRTRRVCAGFCRCVQRETPDSASGQLSQQRSRADTAASEKLFIANQMNALRRQSRHGVCRYPQLYRARERGGGRCGSALRCQNMLDALTG